MIETWKNDFRAFVNSLNLSRDDYKTMMEYIDELPAVQPDHVADIGKKVSISCGHEDDLISRQVTINVVGDWIYNPEDLRYHKDVINSIPAAQPEIIRCKDCKHWDTEWSVSESGAHYCPMVDGNRNSDFYCADAERRTD